MMWTTKATVLAPTTFEVGEGGLVGSINDADSITAEYRDANGAIVRQRIDRSGPVCRDEAHI
jgi:hypothetical protein